MALVVRDLKEEDYDEILVGWWDQWGWTAPERDFLPENGTGGVMVMDDDIPVCAGFCYFANSKVAWVDWIISNKEYRKKPERSHAIRILIYYLTQACKSIGYKYCYALIKNKNLIKTYEDLGYTKGDSYTSEMIKKL